MAYVETNPPAMLTQRVGSAGSGGAIWSYASTDAAAVVEGAGYITNGDDLGMQVGDVVHIFDTDAPLVSLAFVDAVAVGGAAELTAIA